jgi:negative regulator of sigma-B (phosphoserine phosphatase)
VTDALIEIGVAACTLPGEQESGDRCVVRHFDGRTVVGVIDGLGHGPEAARAADGAAEIVEAHGHEPVGLLMQRCHERLLDTRGAVITLLEFRADGTLRWVGAGNVATVLVRCGPHGEPRREELLARSGIAGVVLPSIVSLDAEIAPGDMVVAATDGIRSSFVDALRREPPQRLADRLLENHRTGHDDALVVVARMAGGDS